MAAVLALLPALPSHGHATTTFARPDPLRGIGTRKGWNVFLADACTDTLAAPLNDVVPSVEWTLKADDWRIDHTDAARGDVLTSWKRIQHPLAKMLLGHIEGRCAVWLRPLDDARTVVTIQGGIASRQDISANPALVLAQHAYRNATRDWQRELRSDLSARQELRASTP